MKFNITISYNYDTDETKIKFDKKWNELPEIHQLDAMQDGLFMLEEAYHSLLKQCVNAAQNQDEMIAMLQNMGHEIPIEEEETCNLKNIH